jgi:outer membrane murein-binding lipoprotein Lpp
LWPAEYYSTPTPEAILPKGVSYGCGAASILVLIVVVAGGVFLSTGGLTDFMDFVLGMSFGELKYDPAVTAAQKKVLTSEVDALRENVRAKRVPVAKLQPFLQKLQDASSDGTVNAAEASQLAGAAHALNAGSRAPDKR